MSETINLREFTWDQLKRSDNRCPFIACIGKRGAGKTELLFSYLKHFPEAYNRQGLIVGLGKTYCSNQQARFITNRPKLQMVEAGFDRELEKPFKLMLAKQKQAVADWHKLCQQEPEKYSRWDYDTRPQSLLAISDHSDLVKWSKTDTLKNIAINGRYHFWTSCFLEMQYPAALSPMLRCNLDYIFIFKSTQQSRRRIYEHYAGMFPTFDQFCQVFDKITGDFGSHTCLVIDNTTSSDKLEDQVFWFRADPDQTYKSDHDEETSSSETSSSETSSSETSSSESSSFSIPERLGELPAPEPLEMMSPAKIIYADGSCSLPAGIVELSWKDWVFQSLTSPFTSCLGAFGQSTTDPYSRPKPSNPDSN